jgi:hypothetical protein
MSGRGEIFAGGGVGQASFGGGAQRILVGEFGASTQIQMFDATLTVSPIALDSVQYTDTQIALSWSRRNIDFGAQFGVRVGDQVTDLGATQRTWGSLNAVAWVRPRIAAVLSGGTYPIDPTQGFPGGRFLSASIRVARGARRAPPPLPPVGAPDSGGPIDAAAIQSFTWRKSGVNAVTLRAKAPLAQTVEISGDFSNWTPVRLSSAADRSWAVTLPLKSGTYQMNIRVNGGPWRVPPGLLSMADEFGGSVGLLIVE